MLVHIAVGAGEDGDLCRKVSDCICRATKAALGTSCEDIVQIVTGQVLDVRIPQSAKRDGPKTNAAVVILMYPRSRFSDRRKRMLFGRIGEALEDYQISRRDLVIGMIETPGQNWTFGYDQTELALAMEGGLP